MKPIRIRVGWMFLVVSTITFTSAASAANIVVDGVACTLDEAIVAANTNAPFGGCRAGDDRHGGGDNIRLASDVVLSAVDHYDAEGCGDGLPAVSSNITIRGYGHTIARASAGGTPSFRILDAVAPGRLRLEGVTIENGVAELCDGGGIHGTVVTLVDAAVTNNLTYGGNGGGIAGTAVTLIRSTVSNNQGGGIHVNGQLVLANSTVTGNNGYEDYSGGGIDVRGTALIAYSTVSNNVAGGTWAIGGGLYVDGTVVVDSSTISGNSAAGDVGVGGGIFLFSGAATMVNSTISANHALTGPAGILYGGSGGGIFSSGQDTLFSGPGGTITLIHSTVAGNFAEFTTPPPQFLAGSGGGVFADVLRLTNSVIASNTASNPGTGDCRSLAVQYTGLNFVGDGTCNAASSGQLSGDPLLAQLGDYGGPTFTQPPLAGSPLIDVIGITRRRTCAGTDIAVDQRGVVRARPASGDGCDIGAVEYTVRTPRGTLGLKGGLR